MKVLIIDTIHPALEQLLTEAGFECEVLKSKESVEEAVMDRIAHVEGLVLRSGIAVDQALIERGKGLKFIGRVGAGLEHIDTSFAQRKGIRIFSSPEGNRQAVAEHALGSLLSVMNHLVRADAQVREGKWLRKQNEGDELAGKHVAIIGYGNTGAAFAQLLTGFTLKCLAHDKYISGFGTEHVQEVEMDEVFKRADVVSLHLPYNEETHHLVNEQWIARFERPFYLINTSRGGIVNTNALLIALDEGKIKGACLDVLEYETKNLKMPPLDALPDSARRLIQHPRVLLSPHIAGLTHQSYEKLSRCLAEKIIAAFKSA